MTKKKIKQDKNFIEDPEPRKFKLWVGRHETEVTVSVEDQEGGEANVEAVLEAELDAFRNNLDCGWEEV